MARTLARLPADVRITDYISLGVVAKWLLRVDVERALVATGWLSRRQRDLSAHVVVYYVIALVLYMQVSCREVLRCWLCNKISGKWWVLTVLMCVLPAS